MTDEPSLGRVWLVRLIAAVVVLAVWQMGAAQMGDLFLAAPFSIVRQFGALTSSGELAQYLGPTMLTLVAGLGAGLLVGVPLGLATGRWKRLYRFLEAPVNLLYTTPLIALIPIFLVVLGFGTRTKIVIVFLFAVFPVLINVAAGVRATDGDLLELAHSMGAPERTIWRDILVPSSFPYLVSGVRLGIGRSLIGVVVAEFYAGASGVGYLIVSYSNRFDIASAMVPVVILVLIGVISSAALRVLERRVAPWQV